MTTSDSGADPSVLAGIKVHPVEFGGPALALLAELIASSKAHDPFAEVTVVVPTNYAGVALRRALASGTCGPVSSFGDGLAAVTAVTMFGLAQRLAAPRMHVRGRRPATNHIVDGAIRRALAEDAGMFAAVADHPATQTALARVHRELRDLRADQLEHLQQMSSRAREVVRLHQRASQILADDWYDEFDLLREAARLARRHPAASEAASTDDAELIDGLGTLIIHLPRRLLRHEAALLRAIAPVRDVHIVLGLTGEPGADEIAEAVCGRLSVALPHHEISPTTAHRIVSVSDADTEVRTVVRSVISDLDEGVAPSHIAVLHGPTEPYARILAEQFEAVGVTTHGNSGRTLAESAVGRLVLGLAGMAATTAFGRRLHRSDVFELLADVPIQRLGRSRNSSRSSALVPVGSWERLARAAHVVEGDDWEHRLARHREELNAEAERERASDDPSETRINRLEQDARRCEDLATFMRELAANLNKGRALKQWPQLCNWLGGLIGRYLGTVTAESHPAEWPEWEVTASGRIDRVIGELRDLADVEDAASVAVMSRILAGALDQPHGRSGTTGRGVFVGKIAGAVDLVTERVYVLGMAEGTFPTRQRTDGLVADEERKLLGNALVHSGSYTAEQHRDFLAALSNASGRVTLLFPRGDLRRNAENVPSRWLLPTARKLTSGAQRKVRDYLDGDDLAAAARDRKAADIIEVASLIGSVRNAPFPATAQEYDSASLLAARGDGTTFDRHPLFGVDVAFRRGVELAAARRSSLFTRFDGNLSGVTVPTGGPASVLSATRIEQWARCPRQYMFDRLLRVSEIEEPESIVRLSPFERGRMMHDAIDRFLSDLLAGTSRSDGIRRSAMQPGQSELVGIGAELASDLERRGLTGLELLWELDRATMLADLGEFVQRDLERSGPSGQIIASEHRFGFGDDSAPPVRWDLGDGREVYLRGAIDRIERQSDERLVVIDYKTGSHRSYRGVAPPSRSGASPHDPTVRGTKLQLGVYALAAAHHFGGSTDPRDSVAHVAYWFITSVRGDWQWMGFDVTDWAMQRFAEVVRTILEEIDAGVFPGYVTAADGRHSGMHCPACDPDGLGSTQLRRQWIAKRSDPALAPFFQLAEPDEAAADLTHAEGVGSS
ncbi:PD-(D/E)XK nuclease family protein [Candidatus Poriferisodalis sp.]|uniref:PD-(D/E)XK nuclease family protein n=1 Tax=Candidatus Poriferisodalis sp. TaxID=3101277 RepID=UPI003C6F0A08